MTPHRWGSTTMAREEAKCELPSLHNLLGKCEAPKAAKGGGPCSSMGKFVASHASA